MNDEIKNLVSKLGALAILEEGEPKFVILSYEKAKSLIIHKNIDNSVYSDKDSSEEIDRLNREILILKEEVAQKERELSVGNL
ncbi:MAG: hypothetical protein AAB469_01520 [Patescibacteria group bacterium]